MGMEYLTTGTAKQVGPHSMRPFGDPLSLCRRPLHSS